MVESEAFRKISFVVLIVSPKKPFAKPLALFTKSLKVSRYLQNL